MVDITKGLEDWDRAVSAQEDLAGAAGAVDPDQLMKEGWADYLQYSLGNEQRQTLDTLAQTCGCQQASRSKVEQQLANMCEGHPALARHLFKYLALRASALKESAVAGSVEQQAYARFEEDMAARWKNRLYNDVEYRLSKVAEMNEALGSISPALRQAAQDLKSVSFKDHHQAVRPCDPQRVRYLP